jgi:hypothetical protein
MEAHMPGLDALYFSIPFVNDGGPLLVLPRELLHEWRGIEQRDGTVSASMERDLGEFSGTDYARACAAGGWISVIPVGAGHAVVLGADWLAHDVQWVHIPSIRGDMLIMPEDTVERFESTLVDWLRRADDSAWRQVFDAIRVDSGELVLMHSTNSGAEIMERRTGSYASAGEGIPHHVGIGIYSVQDLTLVLPGLCQFVICRFRPVG